MKPLFIFLFLFGLKAQANLITEDFSTTAKKESATAFWNSTLGVIHPTLQIKDFITGGNTAAIDIGDGSDGVFDAESYPRFGNVVGSTLFINAVAHPILKVTSFHLPAGINLVATGGPLVIYSLSTVLIDGTILCNGTDGAAATGATGGTGGVGRCGGFDGGNGGNASASGGHGLPLAGAVNGGGGGTFVGAGNGAGGGGGGAFTGTSGNPGVAFAPNTAGAGGAGVTDDPIFTNTSGSPGGGGGSGSTLAGGGGGGGGGGTVIIHAVGDITVSTTGFILANGGNGGSAVTGGAGGGGGGGGVVLFTPGNLHLDTGTPVTVAEGTGINALGGRNGGAGRYGRTWDVSNSFTGGGNESNLPIIATGTVEYLTTAQNVISKSYDTKSTMAKFNSVTTVPISTDIVVEVAGSNDDFASDNTGWLALSSLASLESKRYVRFKITLTNSNGVTATKIDSLTVNFTPGVKEDFNFVSGCALVKSTPSGGSRNQVILALMLLLIPLLIQTGMIKRRVPAKIRRKK